MDNKKMTCKDCICYEILCMDTLQDNELKLCKHFKNKADFVEVVRCENCKHWRRMGFDPIFEKEFRYCHNNDSPFVCETRPDTNADDFCSYGERKEEKSGKKMETKKQY